MTNVGLELVSMIESMSNAPAIVDPDGTTTSYADLLGAIDQGRSRIEAASLKPKSKVIVQAPNGVPFVSATIALAIEGHAAVGIEMAQGDAVYIDRASYIQADAVITTRKVRVIQRSSFVRRRIAQLGIDVPPPVDVPTIDWDAPVTALPAVSLPSASRPVDDEEIAFVVFTGGTSAKPRGVQLSHRAVRHYIAGLSQLPEWPHVDSLVADHPQQVLYGLAHGKTVYLSPARTTLRARRTAELLFEEGVHGYFGSPATWEQVLAAGSHRSAATWPKVVLLGGAPVIQPMLERLERELDPSVSIRCLYGMSEAGLIAHISATDKLALLRSGACVGDPVGKLIDGVTATVAPDGELLIGSPSRFSGYVGDSFASGDAFFASGDIGHMAGQQLELLGRKKNMIVQGGVNLYPEQFESRLLAHQVHGVPAFDEVALIPGPTDRYGDEHFILVYASDTTTQSAALRIGRHVLPAGHGPSRAERVAALPRTGRQNKIDRQALATQQHDQSLEAIQAALFDQILRALPARSRERGRAIVMRSVAQHNLRRAQLIEPSATNDDEPVFILGHQRSGTTFLHHALASSPSACAMTLPEMMAPHPLGWRLARAITPLAGLATTAARRAPRWRAVFNRHDLDPTAPEEEEWLFAALGLSGFVPSAFGTLLGDPDFDHIRDRSSWPDASRKALIELYANTVRAWQNQARSSLPLRHVAKNPAFGPLANDLLQAFPRARFVVTLREPHQAICSRVALIEAIHGRPLTETETMTVVQDSLRQIRGLTSQLAVLPSDQVHVVAFDDLMNEPRVVVDECCVWAGLEVPIVLPALRRSEASHPPIGVPSPSEIAAAVPDFMDLCARWELAS